MNATRSLKIVPLLIFVVALCIVWITQLNRHALDRHPIDAPRAVSCLDRYGADFEMIDPSSGRIVQVCHEPDHQPYTWYIIIFTAVGGIVTAYCRQKAKCRRDVESYLQDGGWRYKRKGE